MAYTLANLQDDIRNYTEVSSTVLTDAILERIIKNAEHTIFRAVDVDNERFYATSTTIINKRYVSIPADCRVIRYVQLKIVLMNSIFRSKRYKLYDGVL